MKHKTWNMKHEISGKVIHGSRYGKKLGFPTANLDRRDYLRKKLKIRLGVYAGTVKLPFRPDLPAGGGVEKSISAKNRPLGSARGGTFYSSAIVIGPLDKKGLPKIEAHLLGFKGNLYGEKLTITLTKFIRPFRKFKNEEELKRQIRCDIKLIRQGI